GRREGARVEPGPGAPHHAGRARPLRAATGGDVRRALRRARARRAAGHLLVPGRRGVPQPVRLAARPRQGRLLPARPRDLPHLPRRQRPDHHRQRGDLRGAAPAALHRRLPHDRAARERAELGQGARAGAGGTVSRPLKAAIIGAGGISQSHFDGYRAAGVEVVAISDVDAAALARRLGEWGLERGYTDNAQLFEAGGFDMVSIAAPTAVHHPATLAAAAAGVHVLVEKPLALDLTLADEMIEACKRAGVILMVNHQLRSSGPASKARELVQAGAIGRVTQVRLRQAHDWGGLLTVRPTFAKRSTSGGGTLLDNGTHLADLARFFGGRVDEVYARIATLK